MRIKAGKYYKTRDGRKVGPMVKNPSVNTFQGEGVHQKYSPDYLQRYNQDGTVLYPDDGEEMHTIVEEWNPTWAEMTDEEKGAALLAEYDGDGSEFNPPEPISLDWSAIKPEYKWASVDADDYVFAYRKQPEVSKSVDGWVGKGSAQINHLSSFNRGTVEWQNSLIERPSDV